LDLKAYISSGILESYALGATTLQENAEVEANIAAYPELLIELEQIRQALESYALAHEQEPPADLKEKTRQAIFGSQAALPKANFEVYRNERSASPAFGLRSAASWALLALSIGGNFYLFNQWRSTESKLAIAQTQNSQLAQNELIQKANYESKLAIIENTEFKKVLLKSAEGQEAATASIYFNPTSKEVYLTSLEMPALPKGKQYQLWAIIDGKPVDAGMIAGGNATEKMKLTPNASAFAISIENIGGSTTAAGPQGAVLASGAV
jgi:anti-sigma-K factor RskA